ncbi:MAG: YraN family protein [Saprospiraceae bacterium]|nr:YraN family protein [Saprospiraceae bacterium]
MKPESTRSKGNKGESIALDFLQKAGYDILATNWSAHKAEIDIIAKINDQLVFVEVKTRRSPSSPETAVTHRKQKLIASTAAQYMESINYDWKIRFDIITIIYRSREDFTLEHFVDAFFPGLDW